MPSKQRSYKGSHPGPARAYKGIRVVPCELGRQRDGTWKREELADAIWDATQDFQEIDIAL
jgi:hypothetical protein